MTEHLLTVAEMGEADRGTIASGTAGMVLMENAGAAVAQVIRQYYPPGKTVVLCGPGNNGGDGFVVARRLRAWGWPVTVALLGDRAALRGDAAAMAAQWQGEIAPLGVAVVADAGLIVDGIFGAGLARPVDGIAAAVVVAANRRGVPIVAIDIPTGVHGDSGAILGVAIKATRTVTFARRKPGHLLLPGRIQCGSVELADIGIPGAIVQALAPKTFANAPSLWRHLYPWPDLTAHKYSRGHALVRSGGLASTGAARLAARSALRVGAGLVTLASPPSALMVNAAALTAVMVDSVDGTAGWEAALADKRRNAVLLGPGNGVTDETREAALVALRLGKSTVLDADVLTVFADAPDVLFKAIHSPCILTPHDGEFARLFDTGGDKPTRARRAAAACGAVLVLKGADTVIAAPDGRLAINENAPPDLATAGAGDVLAGLCTGLLAQGMPPFEAAAAAVWLHGEAGRLAGPGLIAEDLPEMLPAVLRRLRGSAA